MAALAKMLGLVGLLLLVASFSNEMTLWFGILALCLAAAAHLYNELRIIRRNVYRILQAN